MPEVSTVDEVPTADRDLIHRYLENRDEECFTALVTRYRGRVFRLAVSILGPGATLEADDVVQDVFVLVARKLRSFRSEAAFSSWLYRIAQRRALELRRRARYRHPHQSDAVLSHLAADDGGEETLGREELLSLYAGVEALGEPLRSTVYLHYWLGETVLAIAELKGIRPGTVKSHLHRARRRLASILETDE